jgi:hypothetical protein
LSSRVFSMAMTAWAAKLVSSSICLSVNGSTFPPIHSYSADQLAQLAPLPHHSFCCFDAATKVIVRLGQLLLHLRLFRVQRGAGAFADNTPFGVAQAGQARRSLNIAPSMRGSETDLIATSIRDF